MPTYEYVCKDCGHHLSAEQRMSDARLTDCPVCGKPGLERQLSAGAFALKGSGWYETDFKGSKSNATKSEAPSAAPACPGGSCACH
ncbi:zinc ribbon domain-containing protein [Acidithiobacillus montserratensis]|uniref:Zinc ribbon domain-containing protein n=1 Tax=Acidithiobacillus montserratensis TaxID=2729135 RepID=A0ACD5HI06_9PROT|nr:zinc ribbon domain-containing protein [Acidithiobacillus montserratensis]MBN2678697.1 zinc ribbon domain-containing protein [Acidithiobacillaceae bacterium]MBU2746958.1 zinc ribbon domain-containing protein [Acidithiobacillus montserratensis]